MQMKLYTRDQMIQAFNYGKKLEGFDWIGDMIDSLTPIELPSEQDIEKESMKFYDNNGGDYYYEEGAKWVIEHIKKQVIP